jgi:deoxyribodipyrimidine photo-lyase
MSATQIIWFRQDLRLADQPALSNAAKAGPILPVYVLDDAAQAHWARGAASRWWLHHSLASLQADFAKQGVQLLLLKGDAVQQLTKLAASVGASAIHAIEHFEPWARRQQTALAQTGLLKLHGSVALAAPDSVRSKTGTAFKVFTPFWRTLCEQMPPALPTAAPKKLVMAEAALKGESLAGLKLVPTAPNWSPKFNGLWQPGETGALKRLASFAPMAQKYGVQRDYCAEDFTSKLAAPLHFGELSVRKVWHAIMSVCGHGAEPFLRQLGWRDFSFNLIITAPDFADVNWRRDFDAFPWGSDAAGLRAWQKGMTGYPIVDAGMRQLWSTGWMHNRVRMITASFLIKHLLIDWREGERWFWDTLVDADLANNAAGWQWTAGSGADASPYFRIFAPVTQGERFDGEGAYVKRWVPELAQMPAKYIHKPWEAPPMILAQAGVTLGKNYPTPIVDHGVARLRALAAFKTLSSSSAVA